MKKNDWSRLAFTSFMGLVLSYAFVFLAALPIRYLRLTFGRKAFIISSALCFSLVLSFGLWQWSLVYLSLCFLIGLYRELEEKRFSIFIASSLAVFTTAAANAFVLLGYSKVTNQNIQALLVEKSQPFMQQLQQIPRFKEANLDDLMWYLPSGLVITLMIVLFVSLTISRVPTTQQHRFELRMFSLPDWLVWVFIGSLGATFVPLGTPLVSLLSMNILAITLAAYFFQGLAVFTYFLDRLSVFGLWRLLAYFLVFFQMFIFISGLGILDYWFNFRHQGLQEHNNQSLKKL